MLTEAPTRIHRYHELTVSVLSLLHGWIWKFLHSAWFPHCHWRIEFWVAHGHFSLQTVFLKRTRPEAFSNHEEHKSWVISVGKSIVHSWSLGCSSAGLGQGCVSKSARVRVNNIERKKKGTKLLAHARVKRLPCMMFSFVPGQRLNKFHFSPLLDSDNSLQVSDPQILQQPLH